MSGAPGARLHPATATSGASPGPLRPAIATSGASPAPAALRAIVVVPARDEEERIGACVAALAAQEGVAPGAWEIVLVLDRCSDATAARARATAGDVPLHLVDGPGRGVGFARRAGMAVAAARLAAAEPARAVIATTDADSVVAADWLARTLSAVAAGAGAVGGRITLDAREAAALPPAVLRARAQEAVHRLAAVRAHTPAAEHHQFSGASLALTPAAHARVGGLPAVAALEDEALERRLRTAGVPIAYRADVRVTTSARTDSSVPRGLAQTLRAARWRAVRAAPSDPVAQPPRDRPPRPGEDVLVLRPADGRRGDELRRGLRDAAPGPGIVVVLGAGVSERAGLALAAPLLDEAALQLVRGAEPASEPLAELVVRPALNLHAPELAVLTSPLTRSWAIRRALLATLALPLGDAVDLTVLLDVFVGHGLDAVAEVAIDAPPAAAAPDPPLAAYVLLAALTARLATAPALSGAFADPGGVRRAELGEHPALVP